MKKLGIIVTDPHDWTAQALIQEAEKRGFETFFPDLMQLETSIGRSVSHRAGDVCLSELDAIIIRDMGPGKNDAHIFRFDALRELEQSGVLIINSPVAIQNAANKFYASCLMAGAGIPAPETFVTQEAEKAIEIIEKLEDVIIKPVFGYKGIGIQRIKKGTVLAPDGNKMKTSPIELIHQIIDEKGMLYIQEFIENSGQDIRAFVVDGKITGAIYRKAPEGWWLNNLSQGGTPVACELTAEQKKMCIDASKAIGAIYAGVDFIESDNGYFILEINATPSGAGIYKSLNINVAEHIITAIESRLIKTGHQND
ncbi:tetrahydromethanopterin:alpha-L-glutamate ligase [Methanolobus bombayensis]|uniref:tetrahydromethanopterin:alpha-L-glutamate ligase n=1 Tax=Methanolobus bombayensis TaxID=38023 RepID=UPI001AE59992|nr:tetrahydromethanopterin:alpha-L-glutamate ligase [Methanolobus bombayensis]MBP1908875.1 tetrahydromethanopterin:alpha-L-glutamate ligase [Methanolobus bombayensis]